MNKRFRIILSIIMMCSLVFTLCSCGNNKEDLTDNSAKTTELQIKNISTVSVGSAHTVALRNDGTVLATGNNDYGQCNVSDWTNIVSVSANGLHTVGLREDGTVLATGDNEFGQCNVSTWSEIISISTGYCHTIGVKRDGTIVAVGDIVKGNNAEGYLDVSEISGVVAASAHYHHAVFLRKDGTVFAVGDNTYGKCNVNGWTDIVKVVAGWTNTVGLKADGTVVAVGDNGERGTDLDVGGWNDITDIGVLEGFVLGATTGEVLFTYDGNDTSPLYGSVAIASSEDHVVGLLPNGTLVAVGDNGDGQCNVSDWTNIKVIK